MQIFCHAKTNVKLGYYVIPAIVHSPLFFIYVFTNYVDIQKKCTDPFGASALSTVA